MPANATHSLGLTQETYEKLRRIARSYFEGRAGHTLQPTALVHEAFAKIAASTELTVRDDAHFTAIAATAMRQVLVDHARAQCAAKRGGKQVKVTLHDPAQPTGDPDAIIAISRCIDVLRERDPRRATAVELHYFVGLTAAEIAEATSVSAPTVERDLRSARAWLKAQLQ